MNQSIDDTRALLPVLLLLLLSWMFELLTNLLCS